MAKATKERGSAKKRSTPKKATTKKSNGEGLHQEEHGQAWQRGESVETSPDESVWNGEDENGDEDDDD